MGTNLSGMDEAEFHPFLELGFTHGHKLAGTLDVHVSRDVVELLELTAASVANGAEQEVIGYFQTEHWIIRGGRSG